MTVAIRELSYGPERPGNEPEEGKRPIGTRVVLAGERSPYARAWRVRQWPRNKKPVGTQFT